MKRKGGGLMKKGVFVAIPLLLSSSLFYASCTNEEKYELHTIDQNDLLVKDVAGSYRPGTSIEVILAFRSGPKVSCLIDGVEYEGRLNADGEESFVYTMPAKDVTLYTMLNGFTGLEETMDLPVSYDYGQYLPNVATKLLGLSLMNPDEKIVDKAIAGDVLRLYYRGELLIQETYPGQAVYGEDFSFVSLTFLKKAEFVELSLKDIVVDPQKPAYVLLDAEGHFESLEDYLSTGERIYAAKDPSTGEIFAYYGYQAREREETPKEESD